MNLPMISADSMGLSVKVLPEQINSSWRRHQKGTKARIGPCQGPGSGTKPGREGSCVGEWIPVRNTATFQNHENKFAKGIWCHEQQTSVSF